MAQTRTGVAVVFRACLLLAGLFGIHAYATDITHDYELDAYHTGKQMMLDMERRRPYSAIKEAISEFARITGSEAGADPETTAKPASA